jgi:hypothetical protein
MKSAMPESIFIIYDYDDHADPEFHVMYDKELALKKAKEIVKDHIDRYGSMTYYVTPCDGRDGWWFWVSGEEHWRVQVYEAKIQYA